MDIPFEDINKVWDEKFEKDQLRSTDFKNFWKNYVPDIFTPKQEGSSCLRINYDEQMVQNVLFDTLERFMYGGDPAEIFPGIKEMDNPPALCGKVFKTGDPTYGCRDCGMDPTCVLCAQCFENSAHNKHRYKISTSSGGGYCDCGDREAWKASVFCKIHSKGENRQENENILEKLSADLVDRIHFVVDTVLSYAKQMLTHEDNYTLPTDLEIEKWNEESYVPVRSLFDHKDSFVMMLYNDETHTYDQVIDALMRSIGCTKRDSFAYATSIDREGRCIVRFSSFHHCNTAKDQMDRPSNRSLSRPLKVQVVHTHIVAHQEFAARLLAWLHDVLKSAQVFRLIFQRIVTKNDCSLIESIFWSDTQMWKSARILWHRLFISGMLMEIESKKIFARVFTQHYSKMMKDFIQDDHEHSVCVVSLAVQLFTMPTIAHMLIAEEDVLARLLNCFLSECQKNLKNGKLHLEAKPRELNTFKRIQYILYDFKYLLGCKPETWTSELRKGFLHGFEKLLTLQAMMQGMDPVVRQVWQHTEFEPEWESAFNLHLKISATMSLVIDWASADQVVLVRAYRMLLKQLGEQTTDDMRRLYTREFLDYSVACIEYDVAASPVSLHLPLTRLLAGLTVHLQKYDLDFNSVQFNVSGKPTPEQLMEPVLRTEVMIAQANAGMWRRNGFSLSNQIFFYHNVRCRQEMLDRDIILLQEAATLIDANEFLIHLLNRFNLINWARTDYELNFMKSNDADNLRQTVNLVEEFLTLILHLVSERYTTGIGDVSDEDCLKKEIIQLLCIEPMPHSVLNKSLPEINHETGMEKVIDTVANFKKASDSKGLFELKDEFYSEYNFFFYHYTKEEQSKSEVAQRNRKKVTREVVCCPPPQPPPFVESFKPILNILQCEVFIHIARTVLQRVGESKSQSVTEAHLLIVLHLIGYALHEEERFIKLDDPYFRFTKKAQNCFILPFLEFLIGIPKTSMHKDILKWTVDRFHEVERLSIPKPSDATSDTSEEVSASSDKLSTASFDRKRKSDIVAERKARIMSKMSNMQKKFIQKNESLFKETEDDSAPADMPPTSIGDPGEPESMVAIGPNQTTPLYRENVYTCILCHQDDSTIPTASNSTGSAMVLGALVQRSKVLSKSRLKVAPLLEPDTLDTLVLPLDLHWGAYISSCGHVMHAKCWQRYFEDVLTRERRKPHRTRQVMSFDIEMNEYLCPLCESLCNTALPLLSNFYSKLRKKKLENLDKKEVKNSDKKERDHNYDKKNFDNTGVANSNRKEQEKDSNNQISIDLWLKGLEYVVKNKVTTVKVTESTTIDLCTSPEKTMSANHDYSSSSDESNSLPSSSVAKGRNKDDQKITSLNFIVKVLTTLTTGIYDQDNIQNLASKVHEELKLQKIQSEKNLKYSAPKLENVIEKLSNRKPPLPRSPKTPRLSQPSTSRLSDMQEEISRMDFDSQGTENIVTTNNFNTENKRFDLENRESFEPESKSEISEMNVDIDASNFSPSKIADMESNIPELSSRDVPHHLSIPKQEDTAQLAVLTQDITAFRTLFTSSDENPCSELPASAIEMIAGFSNTIYSHGLGVDPDHATIRVPQMVWAATAYTIRGLEQNQRTAKRALLTSLSDRLIDSLTVLVNYAAYVPFCSSDISNISTTCIRLLSALLDCPNGEVTKDKLASKDILSLLEFDAFSMLVSLSMSLHCLFGNAVYSLERPIQDLLTLKLVFFAHVVQILLCVNENDFRTESPTDQNFDEFSTCASNSAEGDFLLSILNCSRFYLNLPRVTLDSNRLLLYVKEQCLPFLRCSGMFFHLLTEVPVPEELKSSVWVPESEFICLLRYLGLEPHIGNNFSVRYFHDLLKTWCKNPKLPQLLEDRKLLETKHSSSWWTGVNQLVALPLDYSELMNTISQFPCHASIGDDSRTPTLCLVCGKLLCSQSYCCQMELPEGSEPMVGACTFHANFCGAGLGMFLKVRDCRVLLLCGRVKGCFSTAPYLDRYGETDHGLKRGNPLQLDASSYTKQHNMWISHGVPNAIAHTMEGASSLLMTEWFHF